MAALFFTLLVSVAGTAFAEPQLIRAASSGVFMRSETHPRDFASAFSAGVEKAKTKHTKRHRHHHSKAPFPIDFVYCWSGEAVQHDGEGMPMGNVAGDHQVGQGFGEIRYSLRFLEANAPWFNKVYILTNSPADRPEWLSEASSDKIELVDRCNLLGAKNCPTKNDAACRAVMHKIPGLSEHFVSLDDDMLLLHPLVPSDFYTPNGQPLVLPQNVADEASGLYGDTSGTPGPDMPPSKLPSRMILFHHLPIPLTLSFTKKMEVTYPDWYAFVRSHRTRFLCCNAATVGNGLDESFQRIYPHMVLKLGVGVKATIPPFATCIENGIEDVDSPGPKQATFEKCVLRKIQDPKPKFMTLQNIVQADTWSAVKKTLEMQLAHWPKSKLVALPEGNDDPRSSLYRLTSTLFRMQIHAESVTFDR